MNKLILMTIHFPSLRILWSDSPYSTAEMFHDLIPKSQRIPEFENIISDEGKARVIENHSSNVLEKMPGLALSYIYLTKSVTSLEALGKLTELQISTILGNTEKARSLFRFLHKNVAEHQ